MTQDAPDEWLMLMHQLPPQPAYLRVKIWRRLQALGAIAVKNSVYVLPSSDTAREDFLWLMQEIHTAGGDAFVCASRLIAGLADDALRDLFRAARDADYDMLIQDVTSAMASYAEDTEDQASLYEPLRGRFAHKFHQIARIDFFEAGKKAKAQRALAQFSALLRPGPTDPNRQSDPLSPVHAGWPRNKIWVTRQNLFVDRLASAWFIHRFIDPDAVFKFVAEKDYRPGADEIRFDMHGGEYSHEGDLCTFEVLIDRSRLNDRALTKLAEIIHDIDLKQDKYGHPETAGLMASLSAICAASPQDEERLAKAKSLLDDLYRFFTGAAGDE